MTGVTLWKMIADLDAHPELSEDDITILRPAFEAIKRHEVIQIPELVISHIHRLHARLGQQV